MQRASNTSDVSTPCHWMRSGNVEKFENDLRRDICLMVAPFSIKDFAALVEKARIMERMKIEVEAQHAQQ